MKPLNIFCSLIIFISASGKDYFAAEDAVKDNLLIVAKDGTGDFTSIQSAVDAIPEDNSEQKIIYIRRGIYNEKLFISKSFLTFFGEDKDSTQIIFAELRSIGLKKMPLTGGQEL